MNSTHFKILKYKPEWEELDLFRGWVVPGKNDQKALCTLCDVELVAEINLLRVHARGRKHCSRLKGNQLHHKPALYNRKWEDVTEYKGWLTAGRTDNKAECSLCDIEMRAEKTVIRNHSKSKRHLKSLERYDTLAQLLKSDPSQPLEVRDIRDGEYCHEILIDPSSIHINNQENKLPERSGEYSSPSKQNAANLTDYIIQGYKRLRSCCSICDTTLMKDREGTIVCIRCTDLPENKDEAEATEIFKQENSDSDTEEFGEVIVQINDEKYNSDDDSASVIHEVREKSDNVMKCEVQGVDLGDEVYRLVCALKIKIANLTLQLNETDSKSNLEEMESILQLLNKMKQL